MFKPKSLLLQSLRAPSSSTYAAYSSIRPCACRCMSTSSKSLQAAQPSDVGSSSKSGGKAARSRAARFAPRPGADMVGPPDPISNLRPVKYGSTFEEDLEGSSAATASSSSKTDQRLQSSHPYSLSEFSSLSTGGGSSSRDASGRRRQAKPHSAYFNRLLERLEAAELEHRLRRLRSDAFHQRFWTDNNLRFRGALSEFEEATAYQEQEKGEAGTGTTSSAEKPAAAPATATAPQGALTTPPPKSDSLAPFYTAWLSANSTRHKAYNRALVGGLFEDLGPAFRYESLRRWANVVRKVERALGRGA